MTTIEKLAARASAEGITFSAVLRALRAESASAAASAVVEYDVGREVSSSELAYQLSLARRYGGGYIYPGAFLSADFPLPTLPVEFNNLTRQERLELWAGIEAFETGILPALEAAPIGANVSLEWRNDHVSATSWSKLSADQWEVTDEYDSEREEQLAAEKSAPLYLTRGCRERVAAALRLPLTPTLHRVLDAVIEGEFRSS